MPHALLLSPDDQAVSAITGVLEEMSVTCERPLDGVSAAQKLNSQSFDLVLVDCENLPAAKLIFDVCRRGKNGNNPVPIAIVDGRAGLPTAFRLGAELILTKPVAKDQARGTIRTAVSRVRKNVQPNESAPAQSASAATTGSVMTEERAAAAAVSSQLTSFAEPAPSFVPSPHASAAPSVTTEMNSAVDEVEIDATAADRKLNPPSATFSESHLSESSSVPAGSVNSKPKLPLSDDPVLADLERTDLEELELAESQPAESRRPESQAQSSESKTTPNLPAAKSDTPVSRSRRQGRQKTRRPLVALLMLTLAAGGFYAAWTYQPEFRAIAQPQIDRVLALVGMALPSTPGPSPAKPLTQTALAKAPTSPTNPNTSTSTVPDSATSSAAGSPTAGSQTQTTSAAATAPVQPSAAAVTSTSTTVDMGSGVTKNDSKNDSKKGGKRDATNAAATLLNAQLAGENSAVILTSKGAENRLAHSVAPKYPAEARAGVAQGTVILKAVVDENGKVEGLRLVEGNATLATAAIEAVKQWRYRPYVRDGKAQPFQTVVIVDFQRP